jgi:hypothetical protein
MSFGGGGGWLYDQLREIPRGSDPSVLVEWADIIERKANDERGGLDARRILFRGTVNDEGRFALDVDAPDPDATVRLLNIIQNHLSLMPAITREFYGALMVNLASEAEKRDGLSKGS